MAKLRRIRVNGEDYLLPEREVDYSHLIYKKKERVPDNEGFAFFVELSLLVAIGYVGLWLLA